MRATQLLLVVVTALAVTACADTITFFALMHDINVDHPDYERYGGAGYCGAVMDELGPDRKPVFRPFNSSSPTGQYLDAPCDWPQTGAPPRREFFDTWWRDEPGHNVRIPVRLILNETTPGTYVFARNRPNKFFPINGIGYGADFLSRTNPSTVNPQSLLLNNYHFAIEIHSEFVYSGTEFFDFSGDDDVWVFVNNKLVVDIGGLHPELASSVNLTLVADKVGLEVGKRARFDFFLAERHFSGSNCRITTSIIPTNVAPSAVSASYTLEANATIVDVFQSFDPDGDAVTAHPWVPPHLEPYFRVLPSGEFQFRGPTATDVSNTTVVYRINFHVSDAEFNSCNATLTFTVTQPQPPAGGSAPVVGTTEIALIVVGSVLVIMMVLGAVILFFAVRSRADTWQAEAIEDFKRQNPELNPLFVAAGIDQLNPLYEG